MLDTGCWSMVTGCWLRIAENLKIKKLNTNFEL
jgi:hypothetical protein